jgi:hypothetical protein
MKPPHLLLLQLGEVGHDQQLEDRPLEQRAGGGLLVEQEARIRLRHARIAALQDGRIQEGICTTNVTKEIETLSCGGAQLWEAGSLSRSFMLRPPMTFIGSLESRQAYSTLWTQ